MSILNAMRCIPRAVSEHEKEVQLEGSVLLLFVLLMSKNIERSLNSSARKEFLTKFQKGLSIKVRSCLGLIL